MQQELYNRYASKMFAVCLRYAGNPDDAQDLLQEGFIKIFKNLGKYRGDGSFEGWIRRIFVNTSIEHYRKKANLRTVSDTNELVIEDKDINILDTLAEKDVLKLVQKLPPGYKMVFNMHVVEGYSHKEIADALGINEGTSKSQLARAKVVLKKMIEDKLSQVDGDKSNA
jgi:RNA polymerase sigma factor (sigma-70 family)